MAINAKVKKLEKLIEEIKEIAQEGPEYTDTNCPLLHNHYALSCVLGGLGNHKWYCPFCNEVFYI